MILVPLFGVVTLDQFQHRCAGKRSYSPQLTEIAINQNYIENFKRRVPTS